MTVLCTTCCHILQPPFPGALKEPRGPSIDFTGLHVEIENSLYAARGDASRPPLYYLSPKLLGLGAPASRAPGTHSHKTDPTPHRQEAVRRLDSVVVVVSKATDRGHVGDTLPNQRRGLESLANRLFSPFCSPLGRTHRSQTGGILTCAPHSTPG